ncbi:hypothetical protein HD599_002937 [Conyzicola lurida]|uniref:Galactosyltransferase C-terminal domain-containing protein n=1 Tax=Conyzicola lurida TaxID=1172621 RepID=A0A841AQQ4_9MICO|nr:hypothetical protein [Conyzicola lurida]MBB5844614.1 hypothetical protein [Conyzicola lurida]
MVTVIIPWRPQPSRLAAFEATSGWYRENLPGAVVRTVDSGEVPFNLARCRNVGIAEIADPDEVVIIGDADTIPSIEPLLAAIEAAATSGLVHLPYTAYQWLGREGTAAFFDGAPLPSIEATLVRGACSGVYVTTPRTWASHGGQDERFRGWGFEDSAWFAAHTTLLGSQPQRHEGNVYALHHETQLREGEQYDKNAALRERYREAESSPEAMRELVFGA